MSDGEQNVLIKIVKPRATHACLLLEGTDHEISIAWFEDTKDNPQLSNVLFAICKEAGIGRIVEVSDEKA